MRPKHFFVDFLLIKILSFGFCDAQMNVISESVECSKDGYIYFANFFRYGQRVLIWDKMHNNMTQKHACLKTGLLQLLYEKVTIKMIGGVEIQTVITDKYFRENNLFLSQQGLIVIEQNKPILSNFKNVGWIKLLSYHTKSSIAFVITYGRSSQVECSQSDFKADEMSIILENFFYELWTQMRILKVIAFLPYFCHDVSFVTYDHEAWIATGGKYGRGIRFHSHNDIENNSEQLTVTQLNSGFPLKISIFDRMPTSPHLDTMYVPYLQNIIDKTDGYGGIDGFVMAEAVRHFNYTPQIIVSKGYEMYGYFVENGTAVGSLGDVVNGVADISFNSRFIKEYGSGGYDFLNWIDIDSLCLVVEKAHEIPQWMGLLQTCTWDVGLILLAVPMAVSLIRWLYRRKVRKMRRPLLFLWWDTQVTSIFQGFVSRIIPEERLIIGLCLFLNMIASSIYQGNVKATFSTKKYYSDVNTLEELDKGDYIIGTSPGLQDIFSNRTSNTFKSLKTKLFIYSNSTPVRDVLRGLKAATVERESDANIVLTRDESGPGGEPLLHMVPECPTSFYLGYIVGKNFPFTDNMNKFIRQMVEAGLPTWYYKFTKHVLLVNSRARSFSYAREAEPLDINIVRAAFFILFTGVGISTMVLFIEIGWVYKRRRPKPFKTSHSDP